MYSSVYDLLSLEGTKRSDLVEMTAWLCSHNRDAAHVQPTRPRLINTHSATTFSRLQSYTPCMLIPPSTLKLVPIDMFY